MARHMTMEQVRKFDRVAWPEAEVRNFCFTVVRSNFEHEDNYGALRRLARNLSISFKLLCFYVWLQIYLMELSDSFDDIPPLHEIARDYGIPLAELEKYASERTEVFKKIREADEASLGGGRAFSASDEPSDEELLDDAAYGMIGD
jgi:hypothetical protein